MQDVQLGRQCKKADAGMMGQRLCILAKSLASSYRNVGIGPRDVGVTSYLLLQVGMQVFRIAAWQGGDGEILRYADRTDTTDH